MAKRTAGQWRQCGRSIHADDPVTGCDVLVARTEPIGGDEAEGRANADHIVRCVNSFDALLTACKSLVEMYVKLGMDTPSMPGFERTTVEIARAAIALTETPH